MGHIGYINHSCEPNCMFVRERVWDHCHQESFLLPVALSLTTISPGDFLSVDYQWTPFKGCENIKCYCGSKNCTGWLRRPYKSENTNTVGFVETVSKKNSKKRQKMYLYEEDQ